MQPCSTLGTIKRYGSKVKWSNPGKRVERCPQHFGVLAIKKGDYGRQIYYNSISTLVGYDLSKFQ